MVMTKNYLSLALVCVSMVCGLLSSHAAESIGVASEKQWPMFRGGPDLRGVARSILPAQLKNVWSYKTEGPVKSSPAIADGRVFIGSLDGCVHAIGLNDGSKIWSAKTEGDVESSPLVLGGRVFAGSGDGFLYAFDAKSGKVLWKYKTEEKIPGAPNWVLAPNGKDYWILAGSYDFKLHCVDANTGKQVWTHETGNYINGAPAIYAGEAIFGGCDAILHMVRLSDGQKANEVPAGAYVAGSAAAAIRL